MRRLLIVCGLVLLTIGGAAALPAADAPGAASAAPPDPAPVPAPAFVAPALSAARETTPADPPTPIAPPAAVRTSVDPAHLDVAAPDAPPPAEPATAASTTTTAAPAPPPSPEPTAPPTTVAPVAFTASQAYGSCSEPVPYDIFSGTAVPGATVTISSPHGSGSATADGSGHWQRTVEFPSAPRGESFAVHVVAPGGSVTLSFTAIGGADHHA